MVGWSGSRREIMKLPTLRLAWASRSWFDQSDTMRPVSSSRCALYRKVLHKPLDLQRHGRLELHGVDEPTLVDANRVYRAVEVAQDAHGLGEELTVL